MNYHKIFFFPLMLLLLLTLPLVALENSIENTDSMTPSSNEVLEPIVVESPLVSNDQENGRLYLSAYDPEHYLYPVRIISIDGWLVPDDVLEDELRLALGAHQLTVIPDFSNIEPKSVFMDSPWQEKKITFTINNTQDIAVASRLTNRKDLVWAVQLYRIAVTDTVAKKETSVLDNAAQNKSLLVNLN